MADRRQWPLVGAALLVEAVFFGLIHRGYGNLVIGFGLALLIFGSLFVSGIFFLFRFLTRIEKDADLLGRLVAS